MNTHNETQNAVTRLREEMGKVILGQEELLDLLVVALLSDGHILLEGPPGVAKTTAVKAMADLIGASFSRIQFTPDLLPSDIMGGEIYRPENGTFELYHGPIFHQIILADEINRAPAKVQSALLEAMEEHQVSLGKKTLKLDSMFMVLATQNPWEQEGTYPLPEAQLDRFLMSVQLSYGDVAMERAILAHALQKKMQALGDGDKKASQKNALLEISLEDIQKARLLCLKTQVVESLDHYTSAIVCATRDASRYDAKLGKLIQSGASPRATISLSVAARAYAFLKGRDYVIPQDIQFLAPHVLHHRIALSPEGRIARIRPKEIISSLLAKIPSG